jgi:serine/threonine protein kinase
MDRIGPYQVIGEIGRGGMGVVLRGLDPAIGRPVAIKVILLQEFSDPKDREMLRARLFREAQAAGILNHPGIVTVYYVGEEGENAFIAMEYVNGPSLEKVLNAPEPPSKEFLRRVLWQTAVALDYAHSKGIIHRDIKPPNIMLDENGVVKICDFGIAKGLAGQTSLTQAGTSLGSPFYMSPEQIKGGELDHRADQYSLGVVAYQALTGKRPFPGGNIQSLFFHILNEQPPLAYQVNPALSPAVSDVLQKSLAKEPAGRYGSCAEFVRALLNAWDAPAAPAPRPEIETVETHPKVTAPPSPIPSAAPSAAPSVSPGPSTDAGASPGPKRWMAGVAAAVVLAGLGIGAFVWTRVNSRPAAIVKSIPPPKANPVLPPKIEQSAPQKTEQVLPPPAPAPGPEVVAIEAFTIEPRTVAPGKEATLKWSVKHASEVSIEPDIGVVRAAGTLSVTVQSPTTYNLTAKAAKGPAKTASVTLQVLGPPSIEDFSASRASIQSGQGVVLRWNVSGADRVMIDRGVGGVQPQGNQGVFPTASGTYVLQATGPGGSVSRSVAVSVTYDGDPKILRFVADPEVVDAGETAVLRWEVVNAAEVRIEPGIGRVDAQGRYQVSPRTTTTYRIFGMAKGTFHRDVTVKVR